jgi:hypothetical protein
MILYGLWWKQRGFSLLVKGQKEDGVYSKVGDEVERVPRIETCLFGASHNRSYCRFCF